MAPRTKRTAAEPREQVGESFAVLSNAISIHVPADEDGARPDSITLGNGREVPVKDEHVVLLKGEVFGATTQEELLKFRSLTGVGFLRAVPGPIPVAPTEPESPPAE